MCKRNSYGVCCVSLATILILLTSLANAQDPRTRDFPKQRQFPTKLRPGATNGLDSPVFFGRVNSISKVGQQSYAPMKGIAQPLA